MTDGSPPGTRARWWEDDGTDHDPWRGASGPGAPAPDRTEMVPPAGSPSTSEQPRVPHARRTRLWVVLAVVLVVLVVGAGGALALSALSRPTASEPAPVAGRALDVPAITAPRDAGEFVAAPCSLLERSQAVGLGYTRWGTRPSATGGRECAFVVRQSTLTLRALDGPEGSAFADVHRDRPTVFTPLDVGGLPAVVTQGHVGSQLCRVTVGVAEGQSLQADTYVPSDRNDVPLSDPCARARQGAEAAVANLPPGR